MIYHESDANVDVLKDRQIAVLGYGNLGRPFAQNLRDSKALVMVGSRADPQADQARADGFEVYPIPEAIARANLLLMTMPDEVMPQVYLEQIAPYLKSGDMLVFASGYNIAYQFIEPPIFVDVGLLAPRTLAANVRQAFVEGKGYPTVVSLHQKATPHAEQRLLAVAQAVGGLRQGAVEVTFKQEVELDLFWQQAILPAFHGLMLTAALVLNRAGYPDRDILMELFLSGEAGEFFNQAAVHGLIKTIESLSLTGQYGALSRTERFQESKLMLQMENILGAIQSGDFAREWSSEYADGYPRLENLRRKLGSTTLWQMEKRVLEKADDSTR